MTQVLPGAVLGPFRIDRVLSRDADSSLCRARQQPLDRPVLLRVFDRGARDPDAFRRRAAAVARLEHPSLAAVYGAGAEDGVCYAAQRECEGRPLSSDLPLADLLRTAADAAAGLACAHAAGIMHGAIGPDCVLVVDDAGLVTGLLDAPGGSAADDVAALAGLLNAPASGRIHEAPETAAADLESVLEAALGGEIDAREFERRLRAVRVPAPTRPAERSRVRETTSAPVRKAEARPAAAGPRPFGRYLLHERLGHGGMGLVWKAEDPQLGRFVALKVLLGEGDLDEQLVQRFRREVRAVAALRHPHIVPIHEFGEIEGRHYFTMDLIDGHDLADRTLPARRAAEVVREAARAVHYAHGRGLIHRDLKPANLMLDADDRVYVTDFGLARSAKLDDAKLSRSGAIVGTPAYMPPEQARGSRTVDARADVYSLGATLYALIAGRPPLEGADGAEMLLKVIRDEPVPLRRRRPDVPRDLETIAMKCLEKDPARRFPSAGALADDLERFLQGEPILARPAGLAERIRRSVLRRKALSLGVAGAVAAAAVVLAVLVPKLRRQQEQIEGQRTELTARLTEAQIREELKPLEELLKTARSFTYIAGDDIYTRLDQARSAVARLEEMAAHPEKRRLASVWAALGTGSHLLGDLVRAEQALLEAERIAPGDGGVRLNLVKVLTERSIYLEEEGDERSPEEEAADRRSLADRALEFARQPTGGWSGPGEIDVAVAEAAAARFRNDIDRVLKLIQEMWAKYPDGVGTEELMFLGAICNLGSGRMQMLDLALKRRPHFPLALMYRAVEYSKLGRFRECLEDLDHALKLQPASAVVLSNRGCARAVSEDLDGAIADLDEVLKRNPRNQVARSNRGSIRWQKGDREGGMADLDEAVRRSPRNVKARMNRAGIRARMGDLKGALEDFDVVLAEAPQHSRARLDRASVREKLGDAAGAAEDRRLSVQGREVGADVPFREAMRRIATGDLATGRKILDEILAREPTYLPARINRGRLLVESGELDLAQKDLDEAIRLDPTQAEAWINRGLVWRARRHPHRWLADLDEAIRLDPKIAVAWLSRGLARRALGQFQESLGDFTECLRLDPAAPHALNERGLSHRDLGDREAALKDFREAARLDSRNPEFVKNAGIMAMELGKPEEAMKAFDEALRLKPGMADALANRGVAKRLLKDYEGALRDLTEAIERSPDFADAYVNRGAVWGLLREPRKMKEDYRKALEVAEPNWRGRAMVEMLLKQLEELKP